MRHRHGWAFRRGNGTAGFSLLELVIVLVIGGIMAAVVVGNLGGVQARMGVRSAESNFLSMHAQTRALAVERGIAVGLLASPGDGMVTVREGCDGSGTVLQSRDFGSEFGVTLDIGSGALLNIGDGALVLCMTPRGYANPDGNSFENEARVNFVRGEHVRTVLLRPLGQAVRL